MRIETNLNLEKYIEVTQQIADGFFDEDGSYAPHLGRINTIGTFVDYCVKESKWDGIDNIDVNEVLLDSDVVDAYTNAILNDNPVAMNFGNAYKDALAIVENRNSSIVQFATLVNSFVEKYLTPDNIAKLFGDSERFKKIAESDPDKVISLIEQITK